MTEEMLPNKEVIEKLSEKIQDGDSNPRKVFLIQKLYIDSLENDIAAARWYSPVGYVNSLEKAQEFCKSGRVYTRKDCWAISGEAQEFVFSRLNEIE